MKAKIVTRYSSASAAGSIERSLKADNESAPKPLNIRSRAKAKRVISTITGAQDMESLLTTLDDLILCLIPAGRLLAVITRQSRSGGTKQRSDRRSVPKL